MTFSQKIRHWNHRRIDRMRAWKLTFMRILMSPWQGHLTEDDPAGAILVLRLDGKLGDGVTATGFLRVLKETHPQSRLIVATGPGTESLYQSLSFVDETYIAQKGVLKTIQLYFKLRRNAYRYIINTSHILNPRVLFLTALLPAAKKITFANAHESLFTHHVDVNFQRDHVTDRYGKVLQLLNSDSVNQSLHAADLSYQVRLRPEMQSLMKTGIEDLRKKAKYIIALNSFAGARLRNFNQRTTSAIVRKLLEYPDVKIISLANEGDHRILNQWIDQTYQGRWLNSPQFSSLEHNMAILEQADLIITPDTAWVHIASAFKKKLVAVYREETNPNENNAVIWAPFGTEHEIIMAPSTPAAPDDINNVDTDQVVRAVVRLLELQT